MANPASSLLSSPRTPVFQRGAECGGRVGSDAYDREALSVRLRVDANGSKLGEQGHYRYCATWYQSSTTTKCQFTSYDRNSESNGQAALSWAEDVMRGK